MRRIPCPERPHWKGKAKEFGFNFHTLYGEPYWKESAYYQFTLRQIEEDLETPTEEIHQMCLAVVEKVVADEQLLKRFCIPEDHWGLVRESWQRKDKSLYSRLDLAYSGNGPAKLFENNADTPTSLYETGFWQWLWLEDQIASGVLPASSDQFNLLQEKLVARFQTLKQDMPGTLLHLSCCEGSEEDRGTVQYLEDCAREAGINTEFVFIEDIGLGENGHFTDTNDQSIEWIFKLYPWEFMLREDYGKAVHGSKTQWLEPPWKAIISNKAILPLLWQMFPQHPNLLPAFFDDDPKASFSGRYIKKPIFAREGANVSLMENGHALETSNGPYGEEGYILQGYEPLPTFGEQFALVGSWLVNDEAAGISIREDTHFITQNLSAYLPHIILD